MSHDLNFLHVMASTFLIMAPFVLCMRCIWLPLTVWMSVNKIGWTFQPTSSYYFFSVSIALAPVSQEEFTGREIRPPTIVLSDCCIPNGTLIIAIWCRFYSSLLIRVLIFLLLQLFIEHLYLNFPAVQTHFVFYTAFDSYMGLKRKISTILRTTQKL